MAGSFEGPRETNQSHSAHKQLHTGNRSPLVRPIRYFLQHVFGGGYGLDTISGGMFSTSPRFLAISPAISLLLTSCPSLFNLGKTL